MKNQDRNYAQTLHTWHQDRVPHQSLVVKHLPVVENTITPVAPGPATSGATIISNEEVTVVRSLIHSNSFGILILKHGDTGFFVPRQWVGELTVNGVIATSTAMHMPVEEVYYHIRGREREILGCIFPRTRFIETLAALRGTDPEKVILHERALELPQNASIQLRKGLASMIDSAWRRDTRSSSQLTLSDLTNAVFELVLDTYLYVYPETMRKSGRVREPARIVRMAEEYFAEAGKQPVSLADLCSAVGVSKSALYLAFQSWCGVPPMKYFYNRRLSSVRMQLLHAKPQRGAIKHAALSEGLTELGRFSTDYKRIFGESPSITLNRSID